MRHLVVVLGDQLDINSAVFKDFNAKTDTVWMAEVVEESTHVWNHKARIVYFLSAMRHFRDSLRLKKNPLSYRELDDPQNKGSLAAELAHTLTTEKPEKVILVEPGDYRVKVALEETAKKYKIPLEILTDTHFFSTIEDFRQHTKGRKQLRLEYYYRELRKKTGILMQDGEPEGGEWNYDHDNRGSFGKSGPGTILAPKAFPPDEITKQVIKLVNNKFPGHPGKLDHFDWPVTPEQTTAALADFITKRLPLFGQYQDAMWTKEPYLFHSRISAAMNMKLLNPRDVVQATEEAYKKGKVPLAAAEGFIRQILGWREYVRGIYWLYMPEYLERNSLQASRPLPPFYWTGETDMNCLKHTIGQTLDYGYAHHIQRLMVTGLFALLLGVKPQAVHEWYLAVYVDAVEWVELPNTLGMSQFADGGVMASKPYAASGKYIDRMSNYCKGCQYKPAEKTGEKACPFTVLYWDFLMRHEAILAANPRTIMQVKNLNRMSVSEKKEIRNHAERIALKVLS